LEFIWDLEFVIWDFRRYAPYTMLRYYVRRFLLLIKKSRHSSNSDLLLEATEGAEHGTDQLR